MHPQYFVLGLLTYHTPYTTAVTNGGLAQALVVTEFDERKELFRKELHAARINVDTVITEGLRTAVQDGILHCSDEKKLTWQMDKHPLDYFRDHIIESMGIGHLALIRGTADALSLPPRIEPKRIPLTRTRAIRMH